MTVFHYILYVTLPALSELIMCAAILVFLHCFYDAGYLWSGKKALILTVCVVIFCCTTSAIYAFFPDIFTVAEGVLMILYYLALIIASVYDYPGKRLRPGIRFAIIYVFVVICITLVSLASDSYLNPQLYSLTANETELATEISRNYIIFYLISTVILVLFFTFVYLYLYYKVYKRDIIIKCGKRERIFAIIFPLVFIIMASAIPYTDAENNVSQIVSASIIILFGMLIPTFMYYIRISEYYQGRTAYQEDYIKAELAHFKQYKQTQEETAQFRHDIRNNLLCIRDLLNTGKTTEANEYINDLLDVSDTLRPKYISGDEMLDCIIASKAAIMAENKTRFQIDGVMAGGLPWKPMDVCNVFANALDNAIEACAQLPAENRFINITIKATSQYWHVRIENPVKKQVNVEQLFKKGGGYTSKASPNHHGIGTYNIKHTVELNGGIIKAHCSGNLFVLEIMIDKDRK